jgi:hypothetical protein
MDRKPPVRSGSDAGDETKRPPERADAVRKREAKIDDAIDKTFPASDPVAPGRATGNEPPARPIGRQAPEVRKEDVERAAKR